jgi:MerR family transcriptional regulator, light-induced transcriptional regulator
MAKRAKRPPLPDVGGHDFLSPRGLAEAIGVSESSLKRWADEGLLLVERTAGGHRRIAISEAVQFVRRAGLTPVRPELLGLPAGIAGGSHAGAAHRLHAALVEDREAEARGLLVGLYAEGAGLGWLCDEVIRPALSGIGELWQHDASGIVVEHRAVETCTRAVFQLRQLMRAPSASAPVAIGGSVEGDVYRLPTMLAALVLADAGLRTHDLGADVPVSALRAAVQRYAPGLVWLSASVAPTSAREGARVLEEAAQAAAPAALVFGGRAASEYAAGPYVERLDTLSELAAYARGAAATRSGGSAPYE